MGYPTRHSVPVTTATGGGATEYTPVVRGRISSVRYIAGATGSAFASTADFTVSLEDSGITVWGESNVAAAKTVHPVTEGDLTTGTESTLTEVPVYAAGERVKVEVAQGGNTKTGTFEVVVV